MNAEQRDALKQYVASMREAIASRRVMAIEQLPSEVTQGIDSLADSLDRGAAGFRWPRQRVYDGELITLGFKTALWHATLVAASGFAHERIDPGAHSPEPQLLEFLEALEVGDLPRAYAAEEKLIALYPFPK